MPNSQQDNRKITFRDFSIPGLTDDKYTLHIEQQVDIQTEKESQSNTFSRTQDFWVKGPQFSLPAGTVSVVFPPNKSQEDYSNVLPHVILDKNTLPWERNPQIDSEEIPWLALLLFDEDQQPTTTTVTAIDLANENNNSPFWPGAEVSTEQNDDKVQVIDISKSLVEAILPDYNELKYLAHVRQESDEENLGDISSATSLIVNNRLPQKEKLTTIHLVSLENRFLNEEFNFQNAQDDDLIRFVSMYSWQFYCEDNEQQLLDLFENLNHGELRLPSPQNADAAKYTQQGATLLPHHTRTGDRLYSWYRGPLIAGDLPNNSSFPIRCADELMIYDSRIAMFDVSYAAAWELGRLLALKDKNFSVAFYQWKRNHVYAIHQLEQQEIYGHLPFAQGQEEIDEVPQAVADFFRDLRCLKRVPFNYLIADERLLPEESIRFFCVDTNWTDYLIDGAFTVGRVTSGDAQNDEKLAKRIDAEPTQLTGFVLRSQIVSGWPDLEVYAFSKDSQPLPQLRYSRISNNILLVIFEGQLSSIAIQQKPQTIHFGFSFSQQGADTQFFKRLRQLNGDYYSDAYNVPISWKDRELRVVDILSIVGRMAELLSQNPLSPSLFAMEMVEGVPQVVFQSQT